MKYRSQIYSVAKGSRNISDNNQQLDGEAERVSKQSLRRKLTVEQDEDEPAGSRSMKEKLDLLLEYQKIPEETEGGWLRQKGLHSEHLPLFRQELSSIMTDKADGKDRKIKELEKQIKQQQKELQRKNDALAEMAAIYALKKSSTGTMGLRTWTNNEQRGQTGDSCFCEFLCCSQNRTA